MSTPSGTTDHRPAAGKEQLRLGAISEAVAWGANELLALGWRNSIEAVLGRLAQALEASAACLWRIEQGERYLSAYQFCTWPPPEGADSGIAQLNPTDERLASWITVFKTGGMIARRRQNLPKHEADLLKGLGLDSIIMIGINVAGRFWGVMGFQGCLSHNLCTGKEADTLTLFANTLAEVIDREQTEALRLWERDLFHDLLDNLPELIYATDENGAFIFANTSFVRSLGAKDLEEIRGKTDFDFFPERYSRQFHDEAQAVIATGLPMIDREIDVSGAVGKTCWASTTKIPWRDSSGNVIGIIGLSRDITHRKQAELDLQYRAQFEELIASLSTQFINLPSDKIDTAIDDALEAVGKFADVDRAYVFQFCDEDQTVWSNTHEWCGPDVPAVKDRRQECPVTNTPWWGLRMKRLENIYIPCLEQLPPEAATDKKIFQEDGIESLVGVPLVYGGTLLGFVGFDSVRLGRTWQDHDIALLTALANVFANALQRACVDKLREESEQRYRAVFEYASEGIVIADVQTKMFKHANPAICRMLGYTQSELTRMGVADIHPKADLPHVIAEFDAQARGDKTLAADIPCLRKDGNVVYVDIRTTNVIIAGRHSNVGLVSDITERRQAAEQLKASLAEKEVLLREVHHRVKNNLQVISSLLNLHMQRAPDYQRNVLAECQRQVHAIALIHERLHQSQNLVKVDFAQYVRSLVEEMQRSFGRQADKVTVTVDVEDVLVSIDQAMPCGLILNEALSNVFKHAFPRRRKGQVAVHVFRQGSDKVVLLVRDNGVGMPKDFDIKRSNSLGLTLLSGLAQQLGGNLGLQVGNGTTIRVTFRAL